METLTFTDVSKKVPAVVSKQYKDASLSDKYKFQPTRPVIEKFIQQGWEMINVTGKNISKNSKYGTHIIEFRKPGLTVAGTSDEYRVKIINSHDGSSSFGIYLGVYRQVCENGLVAFDNEIQPFKHKHIGNDFYQYVGESLAHINSLIEIAETRIHQWKTTILTGEQQMELAKGMFRICKRKEPTPQQVTQLLIPHRSEDEGDDLWVVYNTIQENLEKGRYTYIVKGKDGKEFHRSAQGYSRPINKFKYNKLWWEYANNFANGKSKMQSITNESEVVEV